MQLRVIFALGMLATASSTAADVVYGLVERRVSATAEFGSSFADSNSLQGAWSSSVFAYNQLYDQAASPESPTLYAGGGYAAQLSQLNTRSVSGNLSATAWDGDDQFYGYASSRLDAPFSVSTPTNIIITGAWSAQEFPDTSGFAPSYLIHLELFGPSGRLYFGGFTPGVDIYANSLSYMGVLGAGNYNLRVLVYAYARTSVGNHGSWPAQLNFVATIPTPSGGAGLLILAASPWRLRRRG